jgi:hypothetical protein
VREKDKQRAQLCSASKCQTHSLLLCLIIALCGHFMHEAECTASRTRYYLPSSVVLAFAFGINMVTVVIL